MIQTTTAERRMGSQRGTKSSMGFLSGSEQCTRSDSGRVLFADRVACQRLGVGMRCRTDMPHRNPCACHRGVSRPGSEAPTGRDMNSPGRSEAQAWDPRVPKSSRAPTGRDKFDSLAGVIRANLEGALKLSRPFGPLAHFVVAMTRGYGGPPPRAIHVSAPRAFGLRSRAANTGRVAIPKSYSP